MTMSICLRIGTNFIADFITRRSRMLSKFNQFFIVTKDALRILYELNVCSVDYTFRLETRTATWLLPSSTQQWWTVLPNNGGLYIKFYISFFIMNHNALHAESCKFEQTIVNTTHRIIGSSLGSAVCQKRYCYRWKWALFNPQTWLTLVLLNFEMQYQSFLIKKNRSLVITAIHTHGEWFISRLTVRNHP